MPVHPTSHIRHPTSRFLALVGPTASGKTALSLEVAERIGAEIVSMDSRQVYRGMDVGTAKASAAERGRVRHHGIDVADPAERFSAAAFSRMARRLIPEIEARGRVPFLVGGTGFYLRALTHPIFREPALEPERRAALQAVLERRATEALHRWLAALDPETAARLRGGGGRQRLLRALELPLLTGRPLSWWQRHAPPEEEPLRPLVFVLEPPPAAVAAAIDARVARMVDDGLLDEVRALIAAGHDEGSPGLRAHGYQEILPYLRGETTLEAALERVRAATRAYARRQRTWFRHQLPDDAVRLDGARPRDALVREVVERWNRGAAAQHPTSDIRHPTS